MGRRKGGKKGRERQAGREGWKEGKRKDRKTTIQFILFSLEFFKTCVQACTCTWHGLHVQTKDSPR